MDFEEGNPPRCPLGSGERWANGQWWACAPCFQACGLEEMKCIALPAPSQLQQPWNVKKAGRKTHTDHPWETQSPRSAHFQIKGHFGPNIQGMALGQKKSTALKGFCGTATILQDGPQV